MMLLSSCIILASCGTTQIVDAQATTLPKGSIHIDDTPGTQKWMLVYERYRLRRLHGSQEDTQD